MQSSTANFRSDIRRLRAFAKNQKRRFVLVLRLVLVLDESPRIEEGTRTRTRTSRSRCRLFSYTLNTLTRISVSPSVPAPCYGSAVPPSLQDDSPTQARATNSPASFATAHWSVVLTAGDL